VDGEFVVVDAERVIVDAGPIYMDFGGLRSTGSGFFGRLPAQTLMFFFAWQFGAFISLLYYRMNKAAKKCILVDTQAMLDTANSVSNNVSIKEQ